MDIRFASFPVNTLLLGLLYLRIKAKVRGKKQDIRRGLFPTLHNYTSFLILGLNTKVFLSFEDIFIFI